MTEYFTKFVLIILLGIISSSSCSRSGSSRASENYELKTLKDLCGRYGDMVNHSQILQLASMDNPYDKKSALILYTDWFNEYYNTYSTESFKCTFTVKAAPGESIFATIQSMTFESSLNGGCKDYIKFSDNYSVWPRPKSFCGKYKQKTEIINSYYIHYGNFDDSNIIPKSKILSYDAENDELKVEIFVSRDNFNKNLQNNLIVTFTSYKRKANNYEYKIDKIYQCDGIENCDGLKCNDEKDCGIKWWLVFLVTIPIFLGIIITVKIHEMWKNGKLCCSSHRHENNTSQSVDNPSTDIFFIEPENHYTLPPPDTLPSYESLFPTQSTTSLNTNVNTPTTPKIVTDSTAGNPRTNI
ncbi:hypothetical protein HCN44_005007 [Aphidius gifuensis]|uniref:CUB domain-containing protein n=1 Tax=Aphidius gifuensis TaxID=684658 RepID=A0A834XUC8_APHGI|nr:hypothetical protein HCN44_005007 [Aphidius gifuensis]